MRQTRRLASVLLLVAFMITLAAGPSIGKISLQSLTHQLNLNSRKMNDVQRNLRQIKQKQRNAAEQLSISKHRLEATQADLNDTRRQLAETRAKLKKTETELAVVQKRLDARNSLLAERLADTYKHGSVSYLSVLLGAADFWDLLSRGYVVRKVVNTDIELIDAIKKDKQEIDEKRAVLKEQEKRRGILEQRQKALAQTAQQQTVECRELLTDISQDRTKYEQMLAAMEAESRRLARLAQQYQQSPEGRKRAAMVFKGGFLRPVSGGRKTSSFGPRIHPIWKTRSYHTGVDIAVPSGTTIRAAASGVVMWARYNSVFGYHIEIDHGGGVATMYAHCTQGSFMVRPGQSVKQGQPIARVGTSGASTGPHLHFEVHKNGRAVRPPF